ncbi:PKD domain-containing protein [Myxococcota bacterium]
MREFSFLTAFSVCSLCGCGAGKVDIEPTIGDEQPWCRVEPDPTIVGATIVVRAGGLGHAEQVELEIVVGGDSHVVQLIASESGEISFSHMVEHSGAGRVAVYRGARQEGFSITECSFSVLGPDQCGNGICEQTEDCGTCESDCDTCEAVCGNGVLEQNETCDPSSSCPTGCDDGDVCTVDERAGSPETCDVSCVHSEVVDCVDLDGCCPAPCNQVTDSDCVGLEANFVAAATSGPVPLTVQFTDASTGRISAWGWDLDNDGFIDSTVQHPSHTYSQVGTYTVSLTVTGPDGSDVETKSAFVVAGSNGELEKFDDMSPDTELLALWRLEHNTAVAARTSYHWQDPFSFDGRYVASWQGSEVHIFDLYTGSVAKELPGRHSSWARHSHQVFFYRPGEIFRYDVDSDELELITEGVGAGFPRCLSEDDRYVFSSSRGTDPNTGEIYRIENIPGSSVENGRVVMLTDGFEEASEPRASSSHPVIVFKQRQSNAVARDGWWAMRFDGTLAENRSSLRLLSPGWSMGSHASWLGDGDYFIMGNENPPKKIRYLGDGSWGDWEPVISSSLNAGDVSPMGYSGKWLIADRVAGHYFSVIDLETEETTLLAHDPSEKIPDDGGQVDPNPHGSPDGTKALYVSNYDFKNFPSTHLAGPIDGSVPVRSTEGFPDSGILCLANFLVSYDSRTPTSFEGIVLGVFETHQRDVSMPWVVTDFAGRSSSLTDRLSQYERDVYIAVFRLPDAPTISVSTNTIGISPGENHREIRSYQLVGPDHTSTLTSFPIGLTLPAGDYAVKAVEWSGLESEPSQTVTIGAGAYEVVLW